jgi:hypothetical protein
MRLCVCVFVYVCVYMLLCVCVCKWTAAYDETKSRFLFQSNMIAESGTREL